MTRNGVKIGSRGPRLAILLALASACALPAAPLAARTVPAARAVIARDVIVPTPDGKAEAALFTPAGKGSWPAVILWPDIVGLRPVYRDIGRKLAREGFVVLVPNSFYRSMRPSDADLDPWDKAVRPMLMEYRAAATDDGIARDALAYLAYLDTLRQTAKNKKAGTLGYDLGGSYAFRTAAAAPARIAVVGSIYGLGVATARPNSPHLLVPQTKAVYYVAIARDDEKREPEDKVDIRAKLAEAHLPGEVRLFEADHGFAVPSAKAYDAAAAQRAFDGVVSLFKEQLR